MDVVDRAQMEIEMQDAVRKSEADKKEAEETGYCLYCGEPVEKGRRWCDADCRDGWEKEQKLNPYKRM